MGKTRYMIAEIINHNDFKPVTVSLTFTSQREIEFLEALLSGHRSELVKIANENKDDGVREFVFDDSAVTKELFDVLLQISNK